MTRPFFAGFRGSVRICAVRFRPGGAYAFLRHPLSEWTDGRTELENVWTDSARWTDRLAGAPTMRERIRLLERELVRALPRLRPIDLRVRAAVGRICRDPRSANIRELASELNMSRQHLTRLFTKVCGIGPKRFARVERMRRLLKSAPTAGRGTGPRRRWAPGTTTRHT